MKVEVMKLEEIRSLHVTLPFAQIRAGKALFTIEQMKDGKTGGRDLVFRTRDELQALIDGLTEVQKYFNQPPQPTHNEPTTASGTTTTT